MTKKGRLSLILIKFKRTKSTIWTYYYFSDRCQEILNNQCSLLYRCLSHFVSSLSSLFSDIEYSNIVRVVVPVIEEYDSVQCFEPLVVLHFDINQANKSEHHYRHTHYGHCQGLRVVVYRTQRSITAGQLLEAIEEPQNEYDSQWNRAVHVIFGTLGHEFPDSVRVSNDAPVFEMLVTATTGRV